MSCHLPCGSTKRCKFWKRLMKKQKKFPLVVESLLLSVKPARNLSKPERVIKGDDNSAQWNVESYHPVLKELKK